MRKSTDTGHGSALTEKLMPAYHNPDTYNSDTYNRDTCHNDTMPSAPINRLSLSGNIELGAGCTWACHGSPMDRPAHGMDTALEQAGERCENRTPLSDVLAPYSRKLTYTVANSHKHSLANLSTLSPPTLLDYPSKFFFKHSPEREQNAANPLQASIWSVSFPPSGHPVLRAPLRPSAFSRLAALLRSPPPSPLPFEFIRF